MMMKMRMKKKKKMNSVMMNNKIINLNDKGFYLLLY